MKRLLIIIIVLIFSNNNLQAQDCDTLIGYSKEDKYSIYIKNNLEGKVLNNPTDKMHGLILKTNFFKSPTSKGIMIIFWCIRCGKMMDASVKVKIEFMDGSIIFLKRSQYDKDNQAEVGIFSFIMGGDYGNNYELLLFSSKSINKISISGDQIDSNTYSIDFSKSLDFMFAMKCLADLLK